MRTTRLTLGQKDRVKESADFQRVRLEGESLRGTFVTIGFLRDARVTNSRFGFVTSRRVGGAVTRNRIRRRLREIVRKHKPELASAFLVITIAHSRSAHASYAELEREWLRLAGRASILSA